MSAAMGYTQFVHRKPISLPQNRREWPPATLYRTPVCLCPDWFLLNTVMFIYTVVVILVCFAAAVLSLAAFAVSRRKALIPQVLFFAFYAVELVSIFGEEWLQQNLPVDPSTYYDVGLPILRIILGAAILASLWQMLLNLLDKRSLVLTIVPTAVFVVACLAVVYLMPYGALRQWAFYTMRQAYIIWGLLFALWCWKASKDDTYKARLARYKGRYILLWVLLACILIEDLYIILLAPIPSASSGWLLLYLSSRNFSENVMMLFVAYFSVKKSIESLSLRFSAPPEQSEKTDLTGHIEDVLPAYAASHGLSKREQEVLGLVIAGKDNRTIASELFLSEGTIKTHVHNIMKKTQTSSREALKQDFWKR